MIAVKMQKLTVIAQARAIDATAMQGVISISKSIKVIV